MTKSSQFESELTKALNACLRAEKVNAIAYRHFEHKKNEQLFDILIDNRGVELYFAIECKSVDYSQYKRLYFSSAFSCTDAGHQIERESEFLKMSGRAGILAVELRNMEDRRKRCLLIGWPSVIKHWNQDEKGIDLRDLSKFMVIERKAGLYQIEVNDLLVINYLGRKKKTTGQFPNRVYPERSKAMQAAKDVWKRK
jgi:hypothetical protein